LLRAWWRVGPRRGEVRCEGCHSLHESSSTGISDSSSSSSPAIAAAIAAAAAATAGAGHPNGHVVRRARSLYEYVAKFRARTTAEVSKHLNLATSSGGGSNLSSRLAGARFVKGRGAGNPTNRLFGAAAGGGGGGSGGSGGSGGGLGGRGGGLARQPSLLRLEPVHHVWAIGDIHADFKENLAWIQELPAHNSDALLVTGNVATSLTMLARALKKLKGRFKYVFFVFGNQELWTINYGCVSPAFLCLRKVCVCADGKCASFLFFSLRVLRIFFHVHALFPPNGQVRLRGQVLRDP